MKFPTFKNRLRQCSVTHLPFRIQISFLIHMEPARFCYFKKVNNLNQCFLTSAPKTKFQLSIYLIEKLSGMKRVHFAEPASKKARKSVKLQSATTYELLINCSDNLLITILGKQNSRPFGRTGNKDFLNNITLSC